MRGMITIWGKIKVVSKKIQKYLIKFISYNIDYENSATIHLLKF